jgi:hypothetical protein
LERLEERARAAAGFVVSYLAFDWSEEDEARKAAEEFHGKVYIGCSPDDWPESEEVDDAE